MKPVEIGAYTATSAAGIGLDALRSSIERRHSGLRPNDLPDCDIDTWIGRVDNVESVELPAAAQHLESRNNKLAWLALQQDTMLDAIDSLKRAVAIDRIGMIIGTSTSSIGRTEEAYRNLTEAEAFQPEFVQPHVHTLHSPGLFVAVAAGLPGPAMTISTACSSSAKVFASGARWINSGLTDAVLVGGVDSLCLSTLYGFNSLDLVSAEPCRPFDQKRDGINIGEAAGYAILARPGLIDEPAALLVGYGESSDAHHMAQPHPEGDGAVRAIDLALERAGLPADAIDYVNLHGTATKANDASEDRAVSRRFSPRTRVSSTKAWTGHTLGAAGIVEAVMALEAMRHATIPGTLNLAAQDPELSFVVQTRNEPANLRHVMSNSFGFGGSNVSLVFSQVHV